LEGLYHNPLTGYTRLAGFKMQEKADTATFIALDTLVVNFDLYKLLLGKFSISELRLVNPVIQIYQTVSGANYSDLINRYTSDEKIPESDSTNNNGLEVELHNISMVHGVLKYQDLIDERQLHFDDIDVVIPGLYFGNQDTNVDFDLNLIDGGEILSNAQYNNQQATYKLDLELIDINLAAGKEYIKEYLVISDFGASMDAQLEIAGKLGFPDLLTVSGNISVDDYYLDDPESNRILSGDKVSAVVEQVIPFGQKATIESVTITNPTVFYELYTDSTDNIRPLIVDAESDEDPGIATKRKEEPGVMDAPSQDFQLIIRQLNVEGGKLDLVDYNPKAPFNYQFFNLNAEMVNISPEATSKLNLQADAPDRGEINLEWEGNVFDLDQQAFSIQTNIPNLPAFSPYTISFFAVPIESGRFNYVSTNHINNGQLEGLHTIMASGITLGESTGIESLYNIPIKVGLYLLEDKNGDIHLEIPVEGSVEDPNFKYSKIVVNAIINGIVKLVTSPIALVGKLIGAGDDFNEIQYNPANIAVTPDIETSLDYMAEAITQKPQLKFRMVQQYDPEEAAKMIALFLVKQDYYNSTHDNSSIQDYYMINNIDEKDAGFKEFISTQSGQEIKNQQTLIEACYSLKETEIKQALDTIPTAWNREINTQLIQRALSPESFQIISDQNDQGKFEYQLEAVLLEEQNSVIDSLADVE
jgi:hypothetical protein